MSSFDSEANKQIRRCAAERTEIDDSNSWDTYRKIAQVTVIAKTYSGDMELRRLWVVTHPEQDSTIAISIPLPNRHRI